MTDERRRQYLAKADAAIDAGDLETARIILDVVNYADLYDRPDDRG